MELDRHPAFSISHIRFLKLGSFSTLIGSCCQTGLELPNQLANVKNQLVIVSLFSLTPLICISLFRENLHRVKWPVEKAKEKKKKKGL